MSQLDSYLPKKIGWRAEIGFLLNVVLQRYQKKKRKKQFMEIGKKRRREKQKLQCASLIAGSKNQTCKASPMCNSMDSGSCNGFKKASVAMGKKPVVFLGKEGM
jgi:hypothetical protein